MNASLKEELNMQSSGVMNLMQRFNDQAQDFHKLKVEKELLEKGSTMWAKEVEHIDIFENT